MIKIFPWDSEVEPYWINPDNGLQWYVDVDTTKWCTRDTVNDLPKLDAVVFFVCEEVEGGIKPITRILIDKKTNEVLADETSLDVMSCKIDMIRLTLAD